MGEGRTGSVTSRMLFEAERPEENERYLPRRTQSSKLVQSV